MIKGKHKDLNGNYNINKYKSLIWSKEEDNLLIQKAKEYKYNNWKEISLFFKNKNAKQCFSRIKCLDNSIKKGTWTRKEDNKLLRLIDIYGKNWKEISKNLKYRSGKQVRDRYLNNLDPCLNKEKFSEEEDKLLLSLHNIYGNSWKSISSHFKGRTGEIIKNRFHSHIKKKILKDDSIEKDTTVEYKNNENIIYCNEQINQLLDKLENHGNHEMNYDNSLDLLNKLLEYTKLKYNFYSEFKFK